MVSFYVLTYLFAMLENNKYLDFEAYDMNTSGSSQSDS